LDSSQKEQEKTQSLLLQKTNLGKIVAPTVQQVKLQKVDLRAHSRNFLIDTESSKFEQKIKEVCLAQIELTRQKFREEKLKQMRAAK
jgi:hypothetical protein